MRQLGVALNDEGDSAAKEQLHTFIENLYPIIPVLGKTSGEGDAILPKIADFYILSHAGVWVNINCALWWSEDWGLTVKFDCHEDLFARSKDEQVGRSTSFSDQVIDELHEKVEQIKNACLIWK